MMTHWPGPKTLLLDWLAMRASMAARHLSLRLPEQPPDVEAFWEVLHVADGPLPNLGASLELLETNAVGKVYRFAFPSRVVSPDASNNTVHGRCYVPGLAGDVAPEGAPGGSSAATEPSCAGREKSADGAPFILLLHVNGCRDWWFEAQQARRLMQRGWHVGLIALPYHLERRPARLDVGAAVMTPDLPHTLAALGQAVCDAADVLRWARAAGAGRVAVAGWSLGGLVAALVATQIPLDAALLVEPAANLAWMMAHYGLFPKKIRRELRAAGLSQAALERWLAPILPVNLRPKVQPGGLRVLAARYDLLVGREPVEALWRAWGQPRLQIEPTGHVALLFDPALARALDELARGG